MLRMNRFGSRQFVHKFRRQLATTGAESSGQGRSAGSGAGKAFLYGTGILGVVGASGVAYAYYDPEFRKNTEENVPFIKPVLQQIIGNPRDVTQPVSNSVTDLKEKVYSYLPKKKQAIDSKESFESSVPKTSVESQSESERAKEKGEKQDQQTKQSITRENAEKRRVNQEFERNVEIFLTGAQRAVKAAVEAKNAAATAVDHHSKLLKQAMEDPKDPHWQSVEDASKSVEYALKEDSKREKGARSELEKFRKMLNDARSGKLTADNPVLINATETLNKLNYEIDDAIYTVKNAQTESKIMTEFKALVEQGREQFAKELKSILPNVDINTKGTKLTEDELNSLIAHAHIRMDQLRRQLTEQQLRETQHIDQALARQRAELNKQMEEKIDLEIKLERDQFDVNLDAKVQDQARRFEDELRAQLRRSAAAHSEHLEEVLKIQKEQNELGTLRKVDEAVQKERELFHNEVASSMARLQGIENALDSRAVQDAENRKAKELWLACQNLRESVVHGRKSGHDIESRRKPLANELMAIKENSGGDPFVNTLVRSFADTAIESGVYTEEDLKSRFYKVRRLCRRTALIGENGGTVWQYFVSFMQNLFLFDVYKQYRVDEEVDPDSLDTFGILSRANYFLTQEDLASAIKLMLLLRGEAGQVAKDWIEDARNHLETKQTAELLLAHTAATSVRTVY